jgi:hypothetical protein
MCRSRRLSPGNPQFGWPYKQDRTVPILLATLEVRQQRQVIPFQSSAEHLRRDEFLRDGLTGTTGAGNSMVAVPFSAGRQDLVGRYLDCAGFDAVGTSDNRFSNRLFNLALARRRFGTLCAQWVCRSRIASDLKEPNSSGVAERCFAAWVT